MLEPVSFVNLVPSMCDLHKARFSSRVRISNELSEHFNAIRVEMKGSSKFHEDDNIRILIVYGKSEYAMSHDLIDAKYTFCIYVDNIMGVDNKYKDILRKIITCIEYILKYIHPKPYRKNDTKSDIVIKDVFKENLQQRISDVCIYSMWVVFKDSFLDEYKRDNPNDEGIDRLIQVFQNNV